MGRMTEHEQIEVALRELRTDGGTQSRAQIRQDMVDEYASDMLGGATFPPLKVTYDGSSYWLVDGFHRHAAATKIGLTTFRAIVAQGTQRDAILASLKVNNDHGLRRSSEDKRRSVQRLLDDAEWASWSNRRIAEEAGVSLDLVNRMRDEQGGSTERIVQSADGKLRNVAGISKANAERAEGRRPAPTPVQVEEADEAEEELAHVPAAAPALPPALPGLPTNGAAQGLPPALPGLAAPVQAVGEEIGSVPANGAPQPDRKAYMAAVTALRLLGAVRHLVEQQYEAAVLTYCPEGCDDAELPRVEIEPTIVASSARSLLASPGFSGAVSMLGLSARLEE
jgi:ParB-like chromosome segregation protein Spo0J